jgi:hypothetical protein
MIFWLHAVVEAAAVGGGVVGLAIFAVVATRGDAREAAADAAWREAAPDLPPVSDRVTMERQQARLPGPPKRRSASSRPAADGRDGDPIAVSTHGMESK